MADHCGKSDVKRLRVESYATFRPKIKSGDLLFCSGDYLVSRAIRDWTKSPWSHVGIIFNVAAIDRVLLLESVEDMGVRFAPLSKYLHDYEQGRPYKGQLVVARHSQVAPAAVTPIAKFGIDELTRPYDRDEISKIMARILLGRGRAQRDREYNCSELVFECLQRAGINITYDTRGFVAPENVWVDANVKLQARIA